MKTVLSLGLHRQTVFIWASALALLLIASSCLLQIAILVAGIEYGLGFVQPALRLVHVDFEANVPTFYSVGLLLTAALICVLNRWASSKDQGRAASGWMALSVLFALLAADEFMSLHETLNTPASALLKHFEIETLTFPWLYIAVPALVPVAFYFLTFLQTLEADTRRRIVLSAVIYLSGALLFESLSGVAQSAVGYQHMAYQTLCHLEELLEMFGVILFVGATLRHLQKNCAGLTLRVGS